MEMIQCDVYNCCNSGEEVTSNEKLDHKLGYLTEFLKINFKLSFVILFNVSFNFSLLGILF